MTFTNSRKTVTGATLVLGSMMMVPGVLQADSLGALGNLDQTRFEELAENLGAATHYKSVTPAEGLGIIGFDVGFSLSSSDIDSELFDDASEGSFDASDFNLARVQVHKGLPFGLDIGASIARGIDNDATVLGAELRYALLDGGIVSPAVGLRASYSQMEGIDDLDVNNAALELSISKGFLVLTPYAGIGIVRTKADPAAETGLMEESVDLEKLYVGLTINLGLAVTLEADQTGDINTYTAKAGIRF
ncbi:hypothetical protein ACUNV4_11175 [Granulosicoccus sp. 3-233]|uniref:hypothetical protein n=1 Tax=Granulosicoccus sp. 3-233 TaxID=3417969 RepID=UPI003D335B1F